MQVKCPSNITNQDCPIAANFSRVIKLPAISSQADNDARFQSLFDKGQGGGGGGGGAEGTDPGFFLGGDAPLRNGVTDWSRKPILIQNTSCIRKPQVISGGGGGLGAQPLHSPPRSAPDLPFKPYTLTDGDTLF